MLQTHFLQNLLPLGSPSLWDLWVESASSSPSIPSPGPSLSFTFNHPQIAELTLLSTNVLTSILCILIGLYFKKKKKKLWVCGGRGDKGILLICCPTRSSYNFKKMFTDFINSTL